MSVKEILDKTKLKFENDFREYIKIEQRLILPDKLNEHYKSKIEKKLLEDGFIIRYNKGSYYINMKNGKKEKVLNALKLFLENEKQEAPEINFKKIDSKHVNYSSALEIKNSLNFDWKECARKFEIDDEESSYLEWALDELIKKGLIEEVLNEESSESNKTYILL